MTHKFNFNAKYGTKTVKGAWDRIAKAQGLAPNGRFFVEGHGGLFFPVVYLNGDDRHNVFDLASKSIVVFLGS